MTVQELINELNKIEDKSKEVMGLSEMDEFVIKSVNVDNIDTIYLIG